MNTFLDWLLYDCVTSAQLGRRRYERSHVWRNRAERNDEADNVTWSSDAAMQMARVCQAAAARHYAEAMKYRFRYIDELAFIRRADNVRSINAYLDKLKRTNPDGCS